MSTLTKEHAQKISEALKGRKKTPEHCKNLSAALKGRKAWNKGIPRSPETRRKISLAQKGKRRRPVGHKYLHPSTGYIRMIEPNHPSSDASGYIYEHRLVWERVNNKQLPKGWVIHHLNGIKTDNRPENLQAMSNRNHMMLLEPLKERIRALEKENDFLRFQLNANHCLMEFAEKIKEQKNIEPRYAKLVSENFWDLISE